MKKVLIGILVVLLLLVGGVLVAPSLIDWNRYKDEIALRVSAATGRTLTVEGDLDLQILPRPTLRATGARLANLPGAAEADMVRIDELLVRVAPVPLLSGRVQVESIVLVNPVVSLETLSDGRRNWEFGRQPGTLLDSVRLDQVRIEGGTVLYRDAASGSIERLESIDASVVAGSLLGPFQIQSNLSARGVPLEVEVSAGRVGEGGALPLRATIRLEGTESVARFAGIVTTGATPRVQGDLRAEGQDLRRPLAAALTALGRIPAEELPRGLQQPFNLRTALTASNRLVELNGVELQVGETRGTVTLKYRPDGAENGDDGLELTVNVNRLDLDGLRGIIARAEGQRPNEGTPPANPHAAPSVPDFTLPTDLRARVSLGVDALSWRGAVIRQARFEGELAEGTLNVSRAAALLPGGSDVAVAGTVSAADGRPELVLGVEANADNLRALLEWLGVDVGTVPADRLRKFSLTGTVSGTPEQLQVSGMDLRLDTTVARGAVSYADRERPAFGARLDIDRLSLDAYLPSDVNGAKRLEPAWFRGFDAAVEATVGSLSLADMQVQSLRLDGSLSNGSLTLRRFEAQDLMGASVTLGGSIGRLSPLQDMDVAFTLSTSGVGEPLRRLGLTSPIPPERLGPLTAQGRLTGGSERLGIEAEVGAAGGKLQAGGTVDRPLAEPGWDLKVRGTWAEGKDLARLLWPGWRPANLGTVDLYAEVGGSEGALSLSGIQGLLGPTPVTGEATVDLAGERPVVEAQLSTGDLDLDRFLEAPTPGARPRGPLGVALAIDPPTQMELRLGLTSKALAGAGYRLDEAALRLVAGPGAVALEQLDGAFRGGRLGLTGRAARTESGRAELSGTATVVGASLQEGLVPGTGPAQVDLGGRYDLTLEVTAEGAAEEALLRGLDGNGRLTLREGAVTGMDLGALAGDAMARAGQGPNATRQLRALLQRAFAGGRTEAQRAEAAFRIQDGVIEADSLSLTSPAGTASGGGRVDMVERRIDLGLDVLPAVPGEPLPPLRLSVTGPLDQPQRTVAAEAVEQALAQRAEEARRAAAPPPAPTPEPPAPQAAPAQPQASPPPPAQSPPAQSPPAQSPPTQPRPQPRAQAQPAPADSPVGSILDRLRE